MRACKRHTLPRNVYNKWSASRVDPRPTSVCIFINDLPLCLTRASVQCDLFADDGTLNTANDNIDNIRRNLQQSLYDVWMVLQKSDGTKSDENKMHVDGDETKTPEKNISL